MDYRVFHTKVQGASHIASGLVCQDNAGSRKTEDYCAIALADGHGSARYCRSERGSRFAVEAALACIDEFMQSMKADKAMRAALDERENWDRIFSQLEKSILAAWHQKIEEDFAGQPFQEEELEQVDERYRKYYLEGENVEKAYGSTLIAVCQTEEFWFGLHIGDGKCVSLGRDKTFSEPIPWDDKCFLNETTSLCGGDALMDFRYVMRPGEQPAATFIASDGIDDCFSAADENRQLYAFYDKVAELFALYEEGFAQQQLEEYLPILSEKGSRDDMSVAMLYAPELLAGMYQMPEAAAETQTENAEAPAPVETLTESAETPAPAETPTESAEAPAPAETPTESAEAPEPAETPTESAEAPEPTEAVAEAPTETPAEADHA